eukprot:gene12104-14304_t
MWNFKNLHDIIDTVDSGASLVSELRSHQASFLDIFADYAPKAEVDRAAIRGGRFTDANGGPIRLSEPAIAMVEKLSDALDLNEKLVVELLQATQSLGSGIEDDVQMLEKCAAGFYFEDRRCLLECIMAVLEYDPRDEEVERFVQELLTFVGRDGQTLIQRLIQQIRKSLQENTAATSVLPNIVDLRTPRFQERPWKFAQNEECTTLCKCLFFATYHIQSLLRPSDIKELAQLAKDQGGQWENSAKDDHFHSRTEQGFTVILALLNALNPKWSSTQESLKRWQSLAPDFYKSLARDSELDRILGSQAGPPGKANAYIATMEFAWGFVLGSASEETRATQTMLRTSNQAFPFLGQIMSCQSFVDDGNRNEHYTFTIHNLVCAFLQSKVAVPVVQELRNDLDIKPHPSEALPGLLTLLGKIYTDFPAFACGCGQALWEFLDFFHQESLKKVQKAVFFPYLELLTALVSQGHCVITSDGETPSEKVVWDFTLRDDPNAYIGWKIFFQVIASVIEANSEELVGMAAAAELEHNLSRALEAYLKLLGKLVENTQPGEVEVYLRNNRLWPPAAQQLRSNNFPLDALFQFYCCGLPSSLRACVLDAIRALTNTNDRDKNQLEARNTWERLHHTNVIAELGTPGLPGGVHHAGQHQYPGVNHAGGLIPPVETVLAAPTLDLRHQLRQVESGQEEYPETLAFLCLLNRLVEATRGADAPSSDEGRQLLRYFYFVRDDVFYGNFRYRRPEQQWQLKVEALTFFRHLLDLLGPSFGAPQQELRATPPLGPGLGGGLMGGWAPGGQLGGPFLAGGRPVSEPVETPAPGRLVLEDMLQNSGESEMLRTLCAIVEHGYEEVEEQRWHGGPVGIEKERAVLAALQLLEAVFKKDEAFLRSLRESGAAEFCSPLHEVLRGDSRSRRLQKLLLFIHYPPDFDGGKIARSVVASMQVLATRIPNLAEVLLQVGGPALCENLHHGLQKVLVWALRQRYSRRATVDGEDPVEPEEGLLPRHVMELLLQRVDTPAPNMAHLLLGFDLQSMGRQQELDLRGSCLSQMLSMLQAEGDQYLHEDLSFLEQSVRMLYQLLSNPATAEPMWQLLHTPQNVRMLCEQLGQARRRLDDVEDKDRPSLLGLRRWLLQLVTLMLQMAQPEIPEEREVCEALLHKLFGERTLEDVQQDRLRGVQPMEQQHMLLLEIFEAFFQPLPRAPMMDNRTQDHMRTVEELLGSCQVGTESIRGVPIYDFNASSEKLQSVLSARLNEPGLNGDTRETLLDGADASLKYMKEYNHCVEAFQEQGELLKAWVILVEYSMYKCAPILEGMAGGCSLPALICAVLQGVLDALKAPDTTLCTTSLCRLAHTLMAMLQKLGLSATSALPLWSAAAPGGLLDNALVPRGGGGGAAVHHAESTVGSSRLLGLLRQLVGEAQAGLHAMRVNMGAVLQQTQQANSDEEGRTRMYATLLSYLQHCSAPGVRSIPPALLRELLAREQQAQQGATEAALGGALGEGREAAQGFQGAGVRGAMQAAGAEQERLREGNQAVLSVRHGAEMLLRQLCADAQREPQGAKSRQVAYSTLAALVGLDPSVEDVLYKQDMPRQWLEELAGAHPEARQEKLPVHDAQLALLLRLACLQRPAGAARLVQVGVLPMLSQCKLLTVDPSATMLWGTPSPTTHWYHELFASALRLVLALVAALPESEHVSRDVKVFVEKHERRLVRVLERALDQTPNPQVSHLVELHLVVGLLSRACAGPHPPAGATGFLGQELPASMDMLVQRFCQPPPVGIGPANKYACMLRELEMVPVEAAAVAQEKRAKAQRVAGLLRSLQGSLARYLYGKYGIRRSALGALTAPEETRPTLVLVTSFLEMVTTSMAEAVTARDALLQ